MRKRKFVRVETNRHGKTAVYYRRGDGERIRLPDLTDAGFEKAYLAALSGRPIGHERKPSSAMRRRVLQKRALQAIWIGARSRAAAKGLEFSLTNEWILERAERQRYRCELTGIPFLQEPRGPSAKHPYGPSLDRINPKGGYTPDNVRIVVFAINVMLADWGQDVFERVAEAYRLEAEKIAPDAAPLTRAGAEAEKPIDISTLQNDGSPSRSNTLYISEG